MHQSQPLVPATALLVPKYPLILNLTHTTHLPFPRDNLERQFRSCIQLWHPTQSPAFRVCTVHTLCPDVAPCGPADFKLKSKSSSHASHPNTPIHSVLAQGGGKSNKYSQADSGGIGPHATDSGIWRSCDPAMLAFRGCLPYPRGLV